MTDEEKAAHTKTVERNMTSEPNSEYLDNGMKYRTDSQGRTVLEEGWLKTEKAERNETAQRKAGGEDRQKGDHGGHGIGSQFGGSGEQVNMTAMEGDLNTHAKGQRQVKTGELTDEQKQYMNENDDPANLHYNIENYKDLELYMKSEMNKGKDIYFQKTNHYDGDSLRPDYYDINIIIYDEEGNSQSHTFKFYNVDKNSRIEQRDDARKANEDAIIAEEREREERTKAIRAMFEQNSDSLQFFPEHKTDFNKEYLIFAPDKTEDFEHIEKYEDFTQYIKDFIYRRDDEKILWNKGGKNMAVIEDGKIEVEPFTLDSVLELHVNETLNDHAVFYLLARLEKEQQGKPLDAVSDETKIKFKSGGELIFSGVTKNINIICVDQVYYLRIIAVSNTALIDVEKKRRSFQDSDMKYRVIVDKITEEKGSEITYGDAKAADKTVENIVLQYDETDWAFAKRLASHSNAVLIPKIGKDTPDFIFGVDDGGSKGNLESYNYSVSKNLSVYRAMTQFPELGFTEDDSVSYTVTEDDYIFNLGDMLTLDGSPLYVSAINLKLAESVLKCTYTLSTKTAISAGKIFNNIIGLHLSGIVWKVENDTVKVRLDIDEEDSVDNEQDEDNSYPLKYATPYSAEGHTGWYVMPEKNDKLQIIFPTEDEKEAYATAAIRLEDTDKTSDPRTKYLRTPDGKEIKLDEKEILITAKDETTFIRINEDNGIDIITPNPVTVTSNSTISMTSDDDFSITTKKNLTITAGESILMSSKKNNSSISMESSAPGVTINTKDPIAITGDKTIDIKSKDELAAKAGKDLSVDSDKTVAVSGTNAVEISNKKGSSIKMDTNIDLKAMLIKEN